MDLTPVFQEISVFSSSTHGSSNYDQEEVFVMGEKRDQYAPLRYLEKKLELNGGVNGLICQGFLFDTFDLMVEPPFFTWYEKQFGRKLSIRESKNISILYYPNNRIIFDAIEKTNQCYDVFRDQQILLNGKNMPTQLGEWYAKAIFGLKQIRSTSQRGFDFRLGDKRVEIKVSWGDQASPKGLKIRKSLVELSDYTIIIYLSKNLMIREVCFLDSDFILRKFSDKGQMLFLKDIEILSYFFSKSNKHDDKVVNKNALLQFVSPTFAMKIVDRFR